MSNDTTTETNRRNLLTLDVEVETVAAALGWDDWRTTHDICAAPGNTIQISDGECWYLVDTDSAVAWAEDFDPSKVERGDGAYEDFCSHVAIVDPYDVPEIVEDPAAWDGLGGIGGDAFNRIDV